MHEIEHFFADFGEPVTVNGLIARAIVNLADEVVLDEIVVQAPTLELPAEVEAAAGDTCRVRGRPYRIRQVLDQPPDGAIRRLVLAKV
jgi:hypothetical protein